MQNGGIMKLKSILLTVLMAGVTQANAGTLDALWTGCKTVTAGVVLATCQWKLNPVGVIKNTITAANAAVAANAETGFISAVTDSINSKVSEEIYSIKEVAGATALLIASFWAVKYFGGMAIEKIKNAYGYRSEEVTTYETTRRSVRR